jgi:hypothetical protein
MPDIENGDKVLELVTDFLANCDMVRPDESEFGAALATIIANYLVRQGHGDKQHAVQFSYNLLNTLLFGRAREEESDASST